MRAIDGSHIPVCAPANLHIDYYNCKGWYSIFVQAVVDHDYLFTDLNSGWPGSVPGSVSEVRVLVHSELYTKAMLGDLLPDQYATDIYITDIENCTK